MMDQNLINRFIAELEAHVHILERDYNSRKKLYDVDQFLRKNFSVGDHDVYESLVKLAKARCAERGEELNEGKIFESVACECYELLKFFEPKTTITLEQLKEAFFTCNLASKNEVIKKYDRYNKAVELLEVLKKLFVRHQFRKSENNSVAVDSSYNQLIKYTNLYNFLVKGVLEQELDDLDTYQIYGGNFSQEEMIQIYNHILLLIIKNYRKYESHIKAEKKEAVEASIDVRAQELEDKIIESLPRETASIIIPVEPVVEKKVVEEQPAVEEVVQSQDSVELSYLQDEETLKKYSFLESKINEHRRLAKISLSKEESFHTLYESLNNGNELQFIKLSVMPSDYLRFLYYCFKVEFERIKIDMDTLYPVDELDVYTQLLSDDFDKPLKFLTELEAILLKEKEEQDKLNIDEPSVEVEEEKPYKLIFYGKNGPTDILKDIKKYTPEKMKDLVEILNKLEDGKIERCIMITKSVPVPFKSIRGDYVFVTFRILSDGHILVAATNNLDEINSNLHKLSNYDTSEENELCRIIRDGSFDYIKLMKANEEVKETIYSQGYTKGV